VIKAPCRRGGPGAGVSTSDRGVIRPAASVRSFQIEGGLLLFDERSNRLFAYNDTARHAWHLIEAGQAEEDLISEFAKAWEISPSRARADIQSIVSQWQLENLLATDETPTTPVSLERDLVDDRHRTPHQRCISEWICTFRGTTIAFASENEFTLIRQMLEHLETPGVEPQARIELRSSASGETVLVRNGEERIRTHDQALFVGGLWQAILECIHPNVEWLALIHGAAVARHGKGLALIGPSGSGKTTLTAGLISNGFDYYADDLVAVMPPDGRVAPWPLPLSIKPGSLDVVAPLCPELSKAQSYRTKGMDARLLVPGSSNWNLEPVRLRTLVFPNFGYGVSPVLQRISCFQAIERLLTDRIWIGNPITVERVAALLEWLRVTPAYVCTYGRIEDGIRLIGDLTR
jgi:hypothetical protein